MATYFATTFRLFRSKKEELYESLKGSWQQIKDGLIILDEAGYRALMVASSYFHEDGKKIAEEIYAMMKAVQDGKISALTYSQYTRVRTMTSNVEEPTSAENQKSKNIDVILDKTLKSKSGNYGIEPKSWLLMWSQQNCPSCEYSYSDEQILNRFEDSGLARTVSCPCCGQSLEPKLFFRTYISSSALDDVKTDPQQTKKKYEKLSLIKVCTISAPKQADTIPADSEAAAIAPVVSVDKIQILEVENSSITATVDNDAAQDVNMEKKLGSSRSMSMQDKLKIVRSSLIYSNRLGSDIDIEVVEKKRSSTLKHATSLLGSNVDRNWLARQKKS